MVLFTKVKDGIKLVPLVLVKPDIPAGAFITFQVIFEFGVVEIIETVDEIAPEQMT